MKQQVYLMGIIISKSSTETLGETLVKPKVLIEPHYQEIFNRLDWVQSVVYGSYAIRQHTKDPMVIPNDIDVAYFCNSNEELRNEVKRLGYNPSDTETVEGPGKYQNGSILAVHKLQTQPLPTHLVGFLLEGNKSTYEQIYESSDRIGAVIYTLYSSLTPTYCTEKIDECHRNKKFHIDDAGCYDRILKYKNYGYEFETH